MISLVYDKDGWYMVTRIFWDGFNNCSITNYI